MTRESPSFSCAASIVRRCPSCTGSNEPPKMPMRMRRGYRRKDVGGRTKVVGPYVLRPLSYVLPLHGLKERVHERLQARPRGCGDLEEGQPPPPRRFADGSQAPGIGNCIALGGDQD